MGEKKACSELQAVTPSFLKEGRRLEASLGLDFYRNLVWSGKRVAKLDARKIRYSQSPHHPALPEA